MGGTNESADGLMESGMVVNQADLVVEVQESPAAPVVNYRFKVVAGRVDSESTVPFPETALAALEQNGESVFFPPFRAAKQCRQVYGGPQTAQVHGTFEGRAVQAYFSRTDSCEIARWRSLAPLFGADAASSGAI